jgi:protein-arginine kinase activator protein McsA
MLCQQCQRAEATEDITVLVENGPDVQHYCAECWTRVALDAYEPTLRHLDEQLAAMSPEQLTQARQAAPRLRSLFRGSPDVLAALEDILKKYALD